MILVFGATGFTGRMTVKALARRGLPVRAAGRSREKLEQLADNYGVDWVEADVKRPATVRAAADGATAIVSTVGPYSWHGEVAIDAAIDAGIPYFDCTGEPPFIRRVFEEFGPRAQKRGVPLLTTVGYDYIPGTLAGGLALSEAGDDARQVDIGYFLTGEPRSKSLNSFSGGTLQSLQASSNAPQFAWRAGKMIEERAAQRVLDFDVSGKRRTAITIGASEHYTLPRSYSQLETVNVALGWFGPASRLVQAMSIAQSVAGRVPLVSSIPKGLALLPGIRKTVKHDGPSDETREHARTFVVAVARDGDGHRLAQVDVTGPNPYDLTGELLAWAASQAHAGAIKGAGALGAIEAFGLERLEQGCAEVGLVRA